MAKETRHFRFSQSFKRGLNLPDFAFLQIEQLHEMREVHPLMFSFMQAKIASAKIVIGLVHTSSLN